jgi:hypothetical protein
MDQVCQLIERSVLLTTKELIAELQPILRGWGHYYKQAHVRTLFHRLDGWTVHLPRGRAKLAARRYPACETRAVVPPAPPARRVRRRPSARRIRDPTTYLACYHFFEAAAHVFTNLLFPLLH